MTLGLAHLWWDKNVRRRKTGGWMGTKCIITSDHELCLREELTQHAHERDRASFTHT